MPVATEKINANPRIFTPTKAQASKKNTLLWDDKALGSSPEVEDRESEAEPIDNEEVFNLLRSITDPEHPLTLEQLGVVSAEQIKISGSNVTVQFTPTVPHCGMATLIGLSIRVRLLRSLPERYKVDIEVKEGSHQSEQTVNKQLNDKERVAAALENSHLLGVVEQCLSTAGRRGRVGAD